MDIAELIDLSKAINMATAARMLRGRGGAPHVDTVRRWANPRKGCRPQGAAGPVVILNTVRVNGELLTLPDWVAAFERRRAELGRRAPAEPSRPPSRRASGHRRAEARLDQAGVKKGESHASK